MRGHYEKHKNDNDVNILAKVCVNPDHSSRTIYLKCRLSYRGVSAIIKQKRRINNGSNFIRKIL